MQVLFDRSRLAAAEASVDVPTPSGFFAVPAPYAVLQVSPQETDPVRVIRAAQIQLRRWRTVIRLDQAQRSQARWLEPRQRILEIVTARDAILARIREQGSVR